MQWEDRERCPILNIHLFLQLPKLLSIFVITPCKWWKQEMERWERNGGGRWGNRKHTVVMVRREQELGSGEYSITIWLIFSIFFLAAWQNQIWHNEVTFHHLYSEISMRATASRLQTFLSTPGEKERWDFFFFHLLKLLTFDKMLMTHTHLHTVTTLKRQRAQMELYKYVLMKKQ